MNPWDWLGLQTAGAPSIPTGSAPWFPPGPQGMTHDAEQPNPAAPIVDWGKLVGAHFANKIASALTAPRDALYGTMQVTDPETGMPTREAMERGQSVANLAMTGGVPFARQGAAGMAGGKLAQPEGITAYHGSPHDFDKFDLSKIGTGEGAQAYGHGLYFAENEGVARDYRNRLTVGASPMDQTALTYLEKADGDKAKAKTLLQEALGQKLPDTHPIMEAIDRHNTGRMYQVRLNADPNHFLDWDKPLSEQPHHQDTLNALAAVHPTLKDTIENPYSTAQHLESAITHRVAGADRGKTMQMLREAGVPGIKYLDQGSRGNGDGTRNYVVFDDKLIDILKKYGLIGMLGGAGMAPYFPQQGQR